MRKSFAFGALSSLLLIGCSCGNGDGGDVDASSADAPPDALSSLRFETQVTNLADDTPLFDATVTEVGTQNSAQSAPNGRAFLDVSALSDLRVRHELAGNLTNTMEVSIEALIPHVDAEQAQITHLVTTADLDTIYSGLGVTRDPGTTQLLLYVRADDFSPATGATVTVAGAGQSFVRNGQTFEAGAAPISDPLVLIPNVAGGQATVNLSMSCPGPTTVTLTPGEISSAFYICDPAL